MASAPADHWVATAAPLMGSHISRGEQFQSFGCHPLQQAHSPADPKPKAFRDVFPRAAVSEGSWPGLLARGEFELRAWWTGEGHGHDKMQEARLELSVEPLCDSRGLSLSILFSISVSVVLFLFFFFF